MIFHPFKNRPKILEQENPLDRFQVVAPQIRWMERGGGEEEGGEGGIALGNRYWNKGSPHCISVITLIINRRRGEQCRNRVWPKYWRRRQNLVTIAATMDIRPAHGDLSRRSTMPNGVGKSNEPRNMGSRGAPCLPPCIVFIVWIGGSTPPSILYVKLISCSRFVQIVEIRDT